MAHLLPLLPLQPVVYHFVVVVDAMAMAMALVMALVIAMAEDLNPAG